MSFKPDWSEIWTPKEAEYELKGFKFNGPGWYMTTTDAMLVVPIDRKPLGFWNKTSDPNERYEFHVWLAGANPQELFNLIAHAPTREDDRIK